MTIGLNEIVSEHSEIEIETERKRSFRRQTDKQTEWEVPGLISNACCPALALQPSCKRKTEREREP